MQRERQLRRQSGPRLAAGAKGHQPLPRRTLRAAFGGHTACGAWRLAFWHQHMGEETCCFKSHGLWPFATQPQDRNAAHSPAPSGPKATNVRDQLTGASGHFPSLSPGYTRPGQAT